MNSITWIKTKQNFTSSKYSKPLIQILSLTQTLHRICLICKTNIYANKVWHMYEPFSTGNLREWHISYLPFQTHQECIRHWHNIQHQQLWSHHCSWIQSAKWYNKTIFSVVLYNQAMLHTNTSDHNWQSLPSLWTRFDMTVIRRLLMMVPKLTIRSQQKVLIGLDSTQIPLSIGMEFSNCLYYWLVVTGQCFRQFPKIFALTHFVFSQEWVAASSYQHVITTF